MFLKISYSPNQFKYILDVKEIDFTSHFGDDAFKYHYSKDEINEDIYISNEYLVRENGCSRFGDGDKDWFLNKATVKFVDGTTRTICYCGTAYLCDTTGRTVDTLR